MVQKKLMDITQSTQKFWTLELNTHLTIHSLSTSSEKSVADLISLTGVS